MKKPPERQIGVGTARPHITAIIAIALLWWAIAEPRYPKGVAAIGPGLRGASYPKNKRQNILPHSEKLFLHVVVHERIVQKVLFRFQCAVRVKFRRSTPVLGRSKHKLPSRQSISHPLAPPGLLRPGTGALRVRKSRRPQKVSSTLRALEECMAALLPPRKERRASRGGFSEGDPKRATPVITIRASTYSQQADDYPLSPRERDGVRGKGALNPPTLIILSGHRVSSFFRSPPQIQGTFAGADDGAFQS